MSDQDQKQQEQEEETQDQIDVLSQGEDALDSLEAEADTEAGEEKDTENTKEEGTHRGDAEDESGEDSSEQEISDNEAEAAEDDADADETEDKTEKRIADLQAGFTRASQKNADLRKRLIARYEKDLDGFEELSSDEFELLKEEDPDSALEYLEELDEKKEKMAEKARLEEEDRQEAIYNAQAKVAATVIDLASSVGIDVKDKEAVRTFFQSPELEAASEILVNPEYGFQRGEDGLFSAKQLQAAFRLATLEKQATDAQLNGYNAAIKNIKGAVENGSKLSKVAPKGPKFQAGKKMSQEDILQLGEKEVDAELARDEKR